MNPSMDAHSEQDERFRLDTGKLPRRIELELPDGLMEKLKQHADRLNLPVSELIEQILAQSCVESVE